MVAERYELMTPERRMRIASSMFGKSHHRVFAASRLDTARETPCVR
jgi:hypothetical protein